MLTALAGFGAAPHASINSRRRRSTLSVRVSATAELSFVEMCFGMVLLL